MSGTAMPVPDAAAAPKSGGGAPSGAAPVAKPPRKRRKPTPRTDHDENADAAKAELVILRKKAAGKRALIRYEKRKKTRLQRKAANLSVADLQRIALLKECGLIPPHLEPAPGDADSSEEDDAGDPSAASSTGPAGATPAPESPAGAPAEGDASSVEE